MSYSRGGLFSTGVEQECRAALFRWRYRCWLISLLGVVNISGEGTFCRGNDLASSKLPIVPAPAWPAEVSDILSQSDYGIRQRYMLTGEELAAAFAKAETGRLEMSEMSPNGNVASRKTFDKAGRTFSIIYYQPKPSYFQTQTTPGGGLTRKEGNIVVSVIHLYRYDELGREVWQGEYDRKKVLRRALESVYDMNGLKRFMQYRSADGIIRYKMLCDERGHSVGDVYFDDSGKRIIDFRGSIPKGMDASGIPVELRPKPRPNSESTPKKGFFHKVFEKSKNTPP